jgi:hypothetical protein
MQLKKYYKKILILFFLILSILLIKNLGYFFDITKEAIKSDIILCLGGDTKHRIKRALELYNNGYSSKNIIVITDKYNTMVNKKAAYLKTKGLKENNIITNSSTLNTYDELKFIKKYMIENNYKNLIILSAEPHSRRIEILINNFIKFSKDKITYNLVGENSDWWDIDNYYKNKKAILFIMKESLKIIYNYIYYKLDTFFKFHHETTNNLIKYKTSIFKYLNSVFS